MKKILLCIAVMLSLFSHAFASEAVIQAQSGRKLLESYQAGFVTGKVCDNQKGKKRPVCRNKLSQFDVALAVKGPTGLMQIIEADGKSCVSKSKGFETKCYTRNGKTNGVNTEFEVVEPAGYSVQAIRRVIGVPGGYKEVVYTPYADFLNTVSVRRAGKVYVDASITSVYDELKKLGIRSLVNKGAFVHDRVPRELIERLILVEHIDHGRFAKESIVDLVREVYTTLGVNQGIAYNYAKSSAKARGILQVIPSTYEGLRRTYPNAGLVPDFVKGMTDHRNAIKAAVLLADHDVGVIPDVSMRASLLGNSAKRQDYTCSAYNGGPARAMSILAKGLDHVRDNKNSENRIYVQKCRAVASIATSETIGVLGF